MTASFPEEELDSCKMADELVEASGLHSVSAVPEPLALSSSGLGTEPLSLFSSESSSGSSSRSPHFGLVPSGFSLTIEEGDRSMGFEPEPLALSRAELPSTELEPLSLSLSGWTRSMRSLTGVCSSRTYLLLNLL
jgi:hypothetical protein